MEDVEELRVREFLGVQGSVALGKLVPRLRLLRTLVLDSVGLVQEESGKKSRKADLRGLRAIASKLLSSGIAQQLRGLALPGNALGSEGCRIVSQIVRVNALVELDLSGNEIWEHGVQPLADALKSNKCIRDLNLSRNSVRDAGARALGEMLEVNRSLERLNLADNFIFDEGCKALCAGLKGNGKLKSLDLRRNKSGLRTKHEFAQLLRSNKTLIELLLSSADADEPDQDFENHGASNSCTARNESVSYAEILRESLRQNALSRQLEHAQEALRHQELQVSKSCAELEKTKRDVLKPSKVVSDKLRALARRKAALEAETQRLEGILDQTTTRIKRNKVKARELKDENRTMRDERVHSEQTLQQTLARIQELETVRSKLEIRLAGTHEDDASSHQYTATLQRENLRLRSRLEEAQEASRMARIEASQLSVEIEKMMHKLRECDSSQNQAHESLGALQQEEKHLRARLAAALGEGERHRSALENLQDRKMETIARLEEAEEIRASLTELLHDQTEVNTSLLAQVQTLDHVELLSAVDQTLMQEAADRKKETIHLGQELRELHQKLDVEKQSRQDAERRARDAENKLAEFKTQEAVAMESKANEERQHQHEHKYGDRNDNDFGQLLPPLALAELKQPPPPALSASAERPASRSPTVSPKQALPEADAATLKVTDFEFDSDFADESVDGDTAQVIVDDGETPPVVPKKSPRVLAESSRPFALDVTQPSGASKTEASPPLPSRPVVAQEVKIPSPAKDQQPSSPLSGEDSKDLLRRGARISKRSVGGLRWNPGRFVWLNDNLRSVCWTKGSSKQGQHKTLPLWSFMDVVPPKTSNSPRGLRRLSLKGKAPESARVIKLVHIDRRDSFELLCSSIEEAQLWAKALGWAWQKEQDRKTTSPRNEESLPQSPHAPTPGNSPRSARDEEESKDQDQDLREDGGEKPSSLGDNEDRPSSVWHPPPETPYNLNEEALDRLRDEIEDVIDLTPEDQSATYRTIREQVSARVGAKLKSSEWKVWFREEIDDALARIQSSSSEGELSALDNDRRQPTEPSDQDQEELEEWNESELDSVH